MATYTETCHNDAPYYQPTNGGLNFSWRTARGITFGTDTVELIHLERDTKIVGACVTSSAALGGTCAGDLRLNDGSTTVDIISGASLVSADTVTFANVADGIGYVVPTRGFWLEFLFTAAAANPGELYVALWTSNVMFGDESVLEPAG